MPRSALQVFRGNEADMPLLLAGEFGFALDTKRVFIGDGTVNWQIGGNTSPGAARMVSGFTEELITVAAAAYTESSADLIPANSFVDAVAVRVVTEIPAATLVQVGTSGQANRFNTSGTIATAADTVHIDHDGTVGEFWPTASKVRLTPNSTPAAATGQVRVVVFYRSYEAPSS